MPTSNRLIMIVTCRSSSHYYLKQTKIDSINNYSEIFNPIVMSFRHTYLIENKSFN